MTATVDECSSSLCITHGIERDLLIRFDVPWAFFVLGRTSWELYLHVGVLQTLHDHGQEPE